MTLDSLSDLDTSGLCPVKTLSTVLTYWPFRNTALRDGARTSTRTSSVAKGRTASIHCRPAPPRQTEALSSRTSRSRPWKRRSQAVRERKTSVLRACRVTWPPGRLCRVGWPALRDACRGRNDGKTLFDLDVRANTRSLVTHNAENRLLRLGSRHSSHHLDGRRRALPHWDVDRRRQRQPGERGLTQERVRELGLELYRFRLPLLFEIEHLHHDTDDHEQAHDQPDRGDRGASAFGCRLRRRRRHHRARHSLGPCVTVHHPRCDGDQQRRPERPRSH